jgi:hypothetical protein
MDRPAICIRHRRDGCKELLMELPPGDHLAKLELDHLTAVKLLQELISPQRDEQWTRIAVR